MNTKNMNVDVIYTILLVFLLIIDIAIASHLQGIRQKQRKHNCSSQHRCKCVKQLDGSVEAYCSGLELSSVPRFYDNVTIVDLSNNVLTVFSNNGNIPSSVVHLDLSSNLIHGFTDNAFHHLQKLEFLSLKKNNLTYQSSVFKPGLFAGLINLKSLNLQHNLRKSNYLDKYPIVISEIKTLKFLALDGKENVSFSPSFRKLLHLKNLTMSGISGNCYIRSLQGGTFLNTPFIRHLDLSGCHLRHIGNGTFQSLTKLRHLNISHNEHLTFKVLSNMSYDLQYTDIAVIDISKIHCTYGPGTILYTEDTKSLKKTNLKELYMDSNRLVTSDAEFVVNLPRSLRKVSVRDNRLTMGKYVLSLATMSGLEIFDGNKQYTSHFPSSDTNSLQMCYDWRGPDHVYPQFYSDGEDQTIEETERDSSKDSAVNVFKYFKFDKLKSMKLPFPPNLLIFNFEDSGLKYAIPELTFSRNNSLSHLNFRKNILYSWEGPVHNLNSIRYLDLSQNFCSNLSSVFFAEFENLKFLNASNNLLGFVINNKELIDPFQNLYRLQTLDLSFNRIESLPKSIFRDLFRLERLHLDSNLLTEFNFSIGHMKHLSFLDLSKNQLSSIPKGSRDNIIQLAKLANLKLNLLGNHFRCDCSEDSMDFLKWIDSAQKRYKLFKKYERYWCTSINNTKVYFESLSSYLLILEKQCGSHIGLIAGVFAAIVVSITCLVGGLIYRYRWKFRYLYYMAKSRYLGYFTVRDRSHDSSYKYDAFVSYAEEDSEFVGEKFIAEVEEKRNLRLCLHQRDFLGGLAVTDNITMAIHNSRKTIVILSPNYMNSYWCKFEFNMARMENIYSRDEADVLFLVIYRKVPTRHLSLEMLHMINTKSYIEYPNDPDEGDFAFWEDVATAIRY